MDAIALLGLVLAVVALLVVVVGLWQLRESQMAAMGWTNDELNAMQRRNSARMANIEDRQRRHDSELTRLAHGADHPDNMIWDLSTGRTTENTTGEPVPHNTIPPVIGDPLDVSSTDPPTST